MNRKYIVCHHSYTIEYPSYRISYRYNTSILSLFPSQPLVFSAERDGLSPGHCGAGLAAGDAAGDEWPDSRPGGAEGDALVMGIHQSNPNLV